VSAVHRAALAVTNLFPAAMGTALGFQARQIRLPHTVRARCVCVSKAKIHYAIAGLEQVRRWFEAGSNFEAGTSFEPASVMEFGFYRPQRSVVLCLCLPVYSGNDFLTKLPMKWMDFFACWFTLTLSRSVSKVKGHRSKFTVKRGKNSQEESVFGCACTLQMSNLSPN